MQRAAARHHGHALPRFVRRLVGLGAGKRARLVERHRRAFFDAAGGAALEAWPRSVLDWFALDYAALMLARRFGIVPWSKAVILDAVMRCWRDAMGQEARVEDAPEVVAERLRRWLGGAPRRAAVGTDFDPRRLEKYEVVLDRDGDQPVALAQRKRLVGPAGGEAALDGALRLLLQRGEIVPNRETGEIPRQKRFAGTKTKLRFVFFKASFLAGTGGAGG